MITNCSYCFHDETSLDVSRQMGLSLILWRPISRKCRLRQTEIGWSCEWRGEVVAFIWVIFLPHIPGCHQCSVCEGNCLSSCPIWHPCRTPCRHECQYDNNHHGQGCPPNLYHSIPWHCIIRVHMRPCVFFIISNMTPIVHSHHSANIPPCINF